MSYSIVLAGGGTAGHVNPLLAVATEIRVRYPEAVITVLGTKEGLEADLVPSKGFDLHVIPRVPMPRRPSLEWFALPKNLKAAVSSSADAITSIDADVVVGFGGYVSTPAYLAAHKLNVPIVVQEQNARAGIANKIGARYAKAVTTTFSGTSLGESTVTGLPLRAEIQTLIGEIAADREGLRERAAQQLGLDPARPVVLVTGGSLGAQKINETIAASARDLLHTGAQILHLTGKGKSEQVLRDIEALSQEERSRYFVLEYLESMQLAYAVADVVICRSGAGTVCEIAALSIPAVFVPLPIGNGEQRLNAAELIDNNAALIVDNEAFDPNWVVENVVPLIGDTERLEAMAVAAQRVGKPQATSAVVDIIERIAGWKNV